MKLHKHFLECDLKQASEELGCFEDCLELVIRYLKNGDVEQAKHCSTDMTKSLHELSKLASRKNNVEQMDEIFELMQDKDMTIDDLRRDLNAY